MAKYFQITIPDGASNLKLDSQGRGTVQYTVRNVSAAPVDGKAVLVSPAATPGNDPVQKKWVSLDGAGERHFDKDKEQVFNVKVLVPAKSQPGDYTFRMDVASVAVPDLGDQGPAVKFSVTQTAPGKFPWWILIVVLVVLLIGGGVAAWLLSGKKKTEPAPSATTVEVPNLLQMTIPQATQALTKVNLTLDPKVDTVNSAPENSDKIIKQDPDNKAQVQPGTSVHVTQGAEMVAVPQLIGHPYNEAQTLLGQSNLSQGKITTGNNPNFAGGVVFNQSPTNPTPVLTKSVVDLWITPQTTTVPNVVRMSFKDAKNLLEKNNLALGSISGDLLEQPIMSQSPAANLTVQVGTKVDVKVPCKNPNCWEVMRYQSIDYAPRTSMQIRGVQPPSK